MSDETLGAGIDLREEIVSDAAKAAFTKVLQEPGYVPTDKLCRDCRHAVRPAIGMSWDYAKCVHPLNPLNLVTGQKVFPCVIARGFDQLCGWMGVKWEKR